MGSEREAVKPAVWQPAEPGAAAARPRSITRTGVAAFVVGAIVGVVLGVLLLSGRAEAQPSCAVGVTVAALGNACVVTADGHVAVRVSTPVATAATGLAPPTGDAGPALTASLHGPVTAVVVTHVGVPAPVARPAPPQSPAPRLVPAVPQRWAGALEGTRPGRFIEPRRPTAPDAPARLDPPKRPNPPAPQDPPPALPVPPAVPGAPGGAETAVDAAAAVPHGFDAPAASLPLPVVTVSVPAYGGPGEHRGRGPPPDARPG